MKILPSKLLFLEIPKDVEQYENFCENSKLYVLGDKVFVALKHNQTEISILTSTIEKEWAIKIYNVPPENFISTYESKGDIDSIKTEPIFVCHTSMAKSNGTVSRGEAILYAYEKFKK